MYREVPTEISPGFIFENVPGDFPGILLEMPPRINQKLLQKFLQ